MDRVKRTPSHPGGILSRLYMEPMELTVTGLSETLGVSRKTVSKLVNERGAVSPDMALRLSRAFRTTPELWLNLQQAFDLWHAARASADWKKIPCVAA